MIRPFYDDAINSPTRSVDRLANRCALLPADRLLQKRDVLRADGSYNHCHGLRGAVG